MLIILGYINKLPTQHPKGTSVGRRCALIGRPAGQRGEPRQQLVEAIIVLNNKQLPENTAQSRHGFRIKPCISKARVSFSCLPDFLSGQVL